MDPGKEAVARGRVRFIAVDADARVLRCEIAELTGHAASVEVLARLGLAARRSGLRLRLEGASRELAGLLELAGLSEALGVVGVGGQAEEREEAGRVEEGVQGDDAVA